MQQPLATTQTNQRIQIALALLAVYLFWGGTYLAMKVAIHTIPPFLMGGLRFFTAGALVFLWEWRQGAAMPDPTHWWRAAKLGFLLLVLSQGGLAWSEQFVPTGIAAIIFATVPLWMALIAWIFQRGQRPHFIVLTGLLLGFCGILLLVKNTVGNLGGNPLEWLGYCVVTLASIAWAWGSLSSRNAAIPGSPFLAAAMQNLTGGACYLLISLLSGEWSAVSAGSFSAASTLSLLYLIVFGSLIGFGSYIWLLKASDPTLVSTYAYVNPVVALFLGWALGGETLAISDIAATAIILCSVIIITRKQAQEANLIS
jgi:drug/metabolite transporter (DMT)-like permease